MNSLSRRFLISVGLMSLVVTILGSIGAFVVFQQELTNRQLSYLSDYVRERSSNIDKRFTNLTNLHKAAGVELERRMNHLSDADVVRLTDDYFPAKGDGTRRSRDALFDGHLTASGRWIYGMGAFISDADQASMAERRALTAAFSVVSDFGQAARSEYDNFYFFTPADARLVMFGPDRADRLMFYRREAPASLDVSKEEMAQITLPKNDPTRVTRCTNLQRLIQDNMGERLATGCLTPAYVNGRYVGSFGSSIELTGFFLNAIRTTLPGASNLVVTGKGELIAYPGFGTPGRASEDTVADYERKLSLKSLVKAIRRDGQMHGVIDSPDGRQVVAYGRLAGPDWYLLLTYPKSAITLSAARSASWVLAIGAIASLIQTLLVVALARRTIVWPLRQLAGACEPEVYGVRDRRPEREAVSMIERRTDEIGVLANALRGEREKVEEVLASLEDRVRDRTAELERANAEKSRFLANMSHELRTPLNGVIAISETLAAQQKTQQNRELAELIVSSGRLLEQVLTDILDFSKIEAGEIQLSNETFDMQAIVRRIAELHRAAAESKGLELGWAVAEAARGAFVGDQVRLTQVLSNLLSNAVKFTHAGAVRLAVTEEGGQVRFSVTDTGIGFDDAVKARLFGRFQQADGSITRRFGGTGLGLAISRSLVELMGGAISVESTPGVGSVFTFVLPLEAAEAAAATEAVEAQAAFDLSGCRILLAEDHPTNQKVVQLILQSVNVEPEIVENGQLALDRLRAERFDVVLMDMQMPELDGLSATRMLRAFEVAEGLARTPVIMLTANAMDEHIRAGREAGADQHLSKPIRAQALIETIVHAILAAEQAQGDREVA
ncbi:ATP-binding protein [Phenylobacterium sp.]|uniref:ATP-binding protein n=1 Tax=Phenylobacterium sp. TaxID=1871053 RepID=UPI0027371472|nr:ATP-binding protein [Phenylobacterium sp.]MDP3633595.1 ATP-binding protein [Phenylobacterium sp.]